jgi:hypothetical protein
MNIPLSDAMPVITDRVVKFFYVEGDSYCNVYLRNKTFLNTTEPEQIGFHWSQRSLEGDRKYQYNKITLGATLWCLNRLLSQDLIIKNFYLFSSLLI